MKEELDLAGIEERFFVRGRMEILELLTELVLRCEPVTVYWHEGKSRCETTLLDVRDKGMLFDVPADAVHGRELQAAGNCIFVAYPDGIRVLFASGEKIAEVPWDQGSALSIPLPDRIARLQRQESFRIRIPQDQDILVSLFAADGANSGQWPLHDLSTAGVGVSFREPVHPSFAANISRVRLQLPVFGEIDCAVTLRHATVLPDTPCRVGLQFSNLSSEMRVAIRRYIIQAEQERRDAASDQAQPDSDID